MAENLRCLTSIFNSSSRVSLGSIAPLTSFLCVDAFNPRLTVLQSFRSKPSLVDDKKVRQIVSTLDILATLSNMHGDVTDHLTLKGRKNIEPIEIIKV